MGLDVHSCGCECADCWIDPDDESAGDELTEPDDGCTCDEQCDCDCECWKHIPYSRQWLSDYESFQPRSHSTRAAEMRVFNRWAKGRGIDTIEAITYRVLKDYALDHDKAGYANKTIEGRVLAVKKMLDEGEPDDVIDEHPLDREWDITDWGIDPEKTLREKFLDDAGLSEGLSEDEWKELRANVRPPRNRNQLLVDWMWFSGARASEIVSLTLDDIDQENKVLTLPDRKKKDPDETREVLYSPKCDAALAAWLTDRKRFQCLRDADEDWVFCSRKTAPMYPDLLSEVVRQAAWDAGIQHVIGQDAQDRDIHYINCHSLRHGHGTWAADEVGIHRVQQQLGHSSVELTEDKYVHDETTDEENPYRDLYRE